MPRTRRSRFSWLPPEDSSHRVRCWSRRRGHAHAGEPSPAQPSIQRFVARHDDLGGEPLARARLRGAPEGTASRRVVNQVFQRLRERVDVAGRHEQATLGALHHRGNSAHARGDARTAEAHGYENAETEVLGIAGVEADVGDLKRILDRVDLPPDDHALGEAEPLYLADEWRERLAGQDQEPERLARLHARDRLQQEIDALARAQVRRVHHEELVAEAELAADDLGRAARAARGKEVVDDLDPAVAVENIAGPPRAPPAP